MSQLHGFHSDLQLIRSMTNTMSPVNLKHSPSIKLFQRRVYLTAASGGL